MCCRAAGVILAGLCVPQFARQYIKATREKDAKTDSKEKRDASEGAEREKQLRAAIAALATQKKSDFRRHIVETLLFADPTRRLTATAAYARTQQLMKACVVKYNEKYDDIAPQRHTIWSRLQGLFAKITSRSPLCFVLLRVTPAKDNQTNFQFRVVLPLDDDSDAEKQVSACVILHVSCWLLLVAVRVVVLVVHFPLIVFFALLPRFAAQSFTHAVSCSRLFIFSPPVLFVWLGLFVVSFL